MWVCVTCVRHTIEWVCQKPKSSSGRGVAYYVISELSVSLVRSDLSKAVVSLT